MIDLEQEFQLLMSAVIKQINDKVTNGEITQSEADQLTAMVNGRTRTPLIDDEAWDSSEKCW